MIAPVSRVGYFAARSVAPFLLAAGLLVVATPAAADPPVDGNGHVHHVVTGNGGCTAIDAVAFSAEPRGLHRGATASGPSRGPEHLGCP